jgi:hypothetical protein
MDLSGRLDKFEATNRRYREFKKDQFNRYFASPHSEPGSHRTRVNVKFPVGFPPAAVLSF